MTNACRGPGPHTIFEHARSLHPMPEKKCRILFFAEGATLAHVGRPLVVAQSLDPAVYEVFFARPASHTWVTKATNFGLLDLACQESAVFARRLERGQPLYDYTTLLRYVEHDLAVIDRVQPDVIVGDFRLSLGVSARLRTIPYITLCDAYWSPERPLIPVLPALGFTRYVPLPLAKAAFRIVAPLALRAHAIPMERLRARYGLSSLGCDLRRCYTDADLRLFANFPALYPDITPGRGADFIGPISWSPSEGEIPRMTEGEPIIYVTMGSSGDTGVLATLIPILQRSECRILIASAGRALPPMTATTRVKVFEFLPGEEVCKRAVLVVCNGGSPTTNQALTRGVPVLGIASNMDQFLNMDAVARFGSGIMVRADRADKRSLTAAIEALLHNAEFTDRARLLAKSLTQPTNLDVHVRGLLATTACGRQGKS